MSSFRILTPYETELADALFEAMFPSDGDSPDVRDAGVTAYLDLTLEGYGRKELPRYQWLFGALDRYAENKHGRNFASLTLDERTDVLVLLEQGELTDQLPVKDQRDLFGLVVAHLQEGLFADPAHGGNKNAAGWKFLKHPGVWLENSAEENLSPEHATKGGVIKTLADAMQEIPRDTEGHKLKQLGYENAVTPQMTDEVDVLLVGVGAMGGLSAQVFAEAGLSVVGLKPARSGRWTNSSLTSSNTPITRAADWVRNSSRKRPAGVNPPKRKTAAKRPSPWAGWSTASADPPAHGSWLRRFHPWQFAPKSHYDGLYGPGALPEDCTLADWPVSYEQLEPYYTKLEHLIGIAGDESNPFIKRSKPLPLPPTRPFILGNKFTETTRAAGLHPHPVPVGFTTDSYGGRPATGYSAWNNGLGFFRGDRWHPGLGPVPAAIATGNFELRTHARVTRIIMDETGAARGVEWVDPLGRVRRQYARAVILSAYTYENLRLMYLSADSRHENGLGNNTGQLGRHYMTSLATSTRSFPAPNSTGTPARPRRASSWTTSSPRLPFP